MKRIEQKVEDTWCLEDMFESDDFWEEEFGRLQRMIFQYILSTVTFCFIKFRLLG